MLYAAATAALLSVSLLTLSWWAWSMQRIHQHALYVGVTLVTLLTTAVCWLLLHRVPELWPGGLVITLIIDWFIFSRPTIHLPAKRRHALATYNILGSLLAASLSLASQAVATPLPTALNNVIQALQTQEQTDQQSLHNLPDQPSSQDLQNVAISRQFNVLVILGKNGTVDASAGGTPPIGTDFWQLFQYLQTHSESTSGIAELPTRELVELATRSTATGEIVGMHYLNANFLHQVAPNVDWGVFSQGGVTAAVPSSVWQAAGFADWLQGLQLNGLYQSELKDSGQFYYVTVWPAATLTGTVDLVTLKHD